MDNNQDQFLADQVASRDDFLLDKLKEQRKEIDELQEQIEKYKKRDKVSVKIVDKSRDALEKITSIEKNMAIWEDKYTILTEEELGCPCCRVCRLATSYGMVDDMRKTSEFRNLIIIKLVGEWMGVRETAKKVLPRIFLVATGADDEANEAIEEAVKNGTSLDAYFAKMGWEEDDEPVDK